MTKKRFIQVYLDLENHNGCWNCENDLSICTVHHIGTVGFVKGVSHCKLKDWKYKKVEEDHEKIYQLTKENEQLKQFQERVFQLIDKKIEEATKEWETIDWSEGVKQASTEIGLYKNLKKEFLE